LVTQKRNSVVSLYCAGFFLSYVFNFIHQTIIRMKTILKSFGLAALMGTMIACGSNAPDMSKATSSTVSAEDVFTEQSRGQSKINFSQFAAAERFVASDLGVDINTIEQIKVKVEEIDKAAASDDAQLVVNLFNTLMAAQSAESALDVEFNMSAETVEEGVFLFSINSPMEQDLTMEMYDEEGFAMAANNSLSLIEGTNYKALNVGGLDNGTYIFKLKNEEGASFVRKVNIQQ